MWKQKIGISLGSDISNPESVKMLSKIGFEAISPIIKKDVDLESIVREARDCGVEIQSLHAPYLQSKAMWSEDENEYIPAKKELFRALDECKKYNIPVMVMHTWIGFDYNVNITNVGLLNYKEIVDKATEYGVKIAFENTEGIEYLYALMDYFKDNETVGFCWDSGHEMCYNHSIDLLEQYGGRLFVTHLNDNLGISRYDGKVVSNTDDIHLLPYDGIADWDYNIERLKKSRRLEVLNFELNVTSMWERYDNDIYTKMTKEEYYCEAYKRACRIAYRYSR